MSAGRERAVTDLAEMLSSAARGDGEAAWWRDAAEEYLQRHGLVAIDPALVEAVERTKLSDDGAVAATLYDGGVSTDYGEACAALADAVLAQVRR